MFRQVNVLARDMMRRSPAYPNQGGLAMVLVPRLTGQVYVQCPPVSGCSLLTLRVRIVARGQLMALDVEASKIRQNPCRSVRTGWREPM